MVSTSVSYSVERTKEGAYDGEQAALLPDDEHSRAFYREEQKESLYTVKTVPLSTWCTPTCMSVQIER